MSTESVWQSSNSKVKNYYIATNCQWTISRKTHVLFSSSISSVLLLLLVTNERLINIFQLSNVLPENEK